MRDYRELKVWEKAHRLTLDIYQVTKAFPRDETYGLQNQLRRAASSVPTNIAEGCGRDTATELARFLHIATGSLSEVDYQLLLARDLAYIAPPEYDRLVIQLQEVRKMLIVYVQKMNQSARATSTPLQPNS